MHMYSGATTFDDADLKARRQGARFIADTID
jgi:hypothetical protein